jgi:curved DNA-binding protein
MSEQPFCDYYEHLQVSPNADLETIERVYRLLAKKCHPDRQATGSAEKFNMITTAYRFLSNPEKRAAYDARYEEAKRNQWHTINEAYASGGFQADRHIRRTILSILYTRRRQDPSGASLGIVQLENLMVLPGETLDFHIWYLREKHLIERSENGGFEITAQGVDEIEKEGLVLGRDRLLTQSAGSSGNASSLQYIGHAN